MPKHEPYPRGVQVVQSVLDLPIEPGSKDEDHDDSGSVRPPSPLLRLVEKVRGQRG